MDVQVVNPLEIKDWDRNVLRMDNYSVFHSDAWIRTLHEAYGFKPYAIISKEGENFSTMLPVMETSTWLTYRRAISLPFSDYCQPLAVPDADTRLLSPTLQDLARKQDWQFVEFRALAPLSCSEIGGKRWCIHSIPLTGNSTERWSKLKAGNRRNIRKAMGHGIRIVFDQKPDALAEYFRLHCLTRKRLGLPPQPVHFFRSLYRNLIETGASWIALGYWKNHVVASAVFLVFGEKALFKFGASDSRYLHLRSNNLLMWEAIERCALMGYKTLCLGRTDPLNSGLMQFKGQWGGTPSAVEYSYFCNDLTLDKLAISRREAIRNRFTVGANACKTMRHLPILLLRLLGSILYRHMG
jgi:hypothetical protein